MVLFRDLDSGGDWAESCTSFHIVRHFCSQSTMDYMKNTHLCSSVMFGNSPHDLHDPIALYLC